MVLDEEERERDGEEEENSVRYISIRQVSRGDGLDLPSNNSNSETSSLQSARSVETWDSSEFSVVGLDSVSTIDVSTSVWGVYHAAAARCSIPVDPSDVAECSCEAEIEKDGDEAEECDAA